MMFLAVPVRAWFLLIAGSCFFIHMSCTGVYKNFDQHCLAIVLQVLNKSGTKHEISCYAMELAQPFVTKFADKLYKSMLCERALLEEHDPKCLKEECMTFVEQKCREKMNEYFEQFAKKS